ncbi:hypothetical protein NQ315_000578 [Exocentrus adspersus]|uniref:Uncharacterized protein n=1 Tax=Exocentrus adspersus TaxID=1586481 RepID=A0AAV8VD98_9CUCU|nr:hypothetical protein NQ315_000578 [Exocentrus adspersus]
MYFLFFQIPSYVQGQIQPNITLFLHIIILEPHFVRQCSDINTSTIYDMYTSSLCFGILTAKPLPSLSDFPLYVSLGSINVKVKINAKEVVLEDEDIQAIKRFHFLVFDDVLNILHPFLIFDNDQEAEMLLLVPVNKLTDEIEFNFVNTAWDIKSVIELSREEKLNLEVTPETFLRKIVSPWYRRDTAATYIVTEVCLNKCALTPFPNEDYSDFQAYFQEKHNQTVLNTQHPLLLVKGLTKRLNFIKPKGIETKRKREKVYEEMTEYLIPELVVKQEFPAALWIQSSFLPTILSRISYLLQLEELRCKIAKEAGLGHEIIPQKPLQLDEYLLNYIPNIEEDQVSENTGISIEIPLLHETELSLASTLPQYNKDYAAKVLEGEYPWADIEEPKDVERDLNVTLMDIEYYENFVWQGVDMDNVTKNDSPVKRNEKQLALTYYKDFVHKPIKLLSTDSNEEGPDLSEMFRALTAAKANEIVNLERLETLGDSFLKFISSVYISLRFPTYDEGRATSLKGRLVSNRNLFYLAKIRNLSGTMKFKELSPREEWLPPAFKIPKEMLKRIQSKELSVNALFNINIPREQQISGILSEDILSEIIEEECPPDENEESSYSNTAAFLQCQYIGDKHISDVVESLLGVYFKCNGLAGGIKFIEWIGLIPASENLENLLKAPVPNPIINSQSADDRINFHLPYWQDIENILGYKFKNRGFLLQALTHSSYTQNRDTLSYEKLEFLGDAILDFLITCYIYESCGNLNPGDLTDLRSALVNNNTFASLVVRCGIQKFLLLMNTKLQGQIDKFVEYLKAKNYVIDDEVLILLEEDELILAEYVDVPKILGDVFEALAGAIYLDSGKDLNAVWTVFYKIMWKEIDLFSKNVPKNIVRRLFEWPGTYPKFGNIIATENQKCLIPLQFMLNGMQKLVHGCGSNKAMAKRAAAKLALRFLEK